MTSYKTYRNALIIDSCTIQNIIPPFVFKVTNDRGSDDCVADTFT